VKFPLRIVVTCGVVFGLLVPMSIATLYTGAKQKERLLLDARRAHLQATTVLAIGVE